MPDIGRKAMDAKSQKPETITPSMASGVMTRVTQGIASTLASKPTKDTCPKNNKVRGAKATVTVACSRSRAPTGRSMPMPPARRQTAPKRCNKGVACAPSRQEGAAAPSPFGASSKRWRREGSEAIKMPTATKLNQNPGCSKAQGSQASTTAPAVSQTKTPGQSRADSFKTTTTPSIQQVRCAGSPQPLKTA
jgi:hypothetical protein